MRLETESSINDASLSRGVGVAKAGLVFTHQINKTQSQRDTPTVYITPGAFPTRTQPHSKTYRITTALDAHLSHLQGDDHLAVDLLLGARQLHHARDALAAHRAQWRPLHRAFVRAGEADPAVAALQ